MGVCVCVPKNGVIVAYTQLYIYIYIYNHTHIYSVSLQIYTFI